MASITRFNNGNYYLTKKKKNVFLVKFTNTGSGVIPMYNINTPRRFIGKKIRFKVEVVDDILGGSKC